VVRAQSQVIFDEERNAYVSCTTDGIDIFGLPENAEYIEELHTGDGLLRAQNTAIGMGGDGLLHGRPKDISGTGEGHSGGDHGHTDDVTDVHWHLPDDHTHQSLPARTGSRSYPPDEGDTIILAHSRDHSTREPPASRQHIEHSRRLRRENHTARRQATAMTKKSTQRLLLPSLITTRVTRSQGGSFDSIDAGTNYHQWGIDICRSSGRPTTRILKKAKQLHVYKIQGTPSY